MPIDLDRLYDLQRSLTMADWLQAAKEVFGDPPNELGDENPVRAVLARGPRLHHTRRKARS
jgi:hypothetical protein